MGLAGWLVSYLVYLHGDVAAWYGDVTMLAGVQKFGPRFYELRRIFWETLPDCGFVVLIAALHLRRVVAGGQSRDVVTSYGKNLSAPFFGGWESWSAVRTCSTTPSPLGPRRDDPGGRNPATCRSRGQR